MLLAYVTAFAVVVAVYRQKSAGVLARLVGVLLAAIIAGTAYAAGQPEAGRSASPNDALAGIAVLGVGLSISCMVLGRFLHRS